MKNQIHPSALIHPDVIIGSGNYIGPYCIIGYSCESRANWGIEGRVVIGNNNVITGHVTIDSGMESETVVFNNCFIMKHSHIGHDAKIHDGCTLSPGAKVGGHAILFQNVNLGLNCSIHQRQQIAEGCIVGMNSCVTKSLLTEPFRKYAGVPAKDIGSNKI